MSAERPKPEAAVARPGGRRFKAILRLVVLLSLPLLLLFLIFAGGLYCGARNSAKLVVFESRWLGIDPPAGFAAGGDDDAEPDEPDVDDGGDAPSPAEPSPADPPTPAVKPTPTPSPTPTQPTSPQPATPSPEQPNPAAQGPLAMAAAEPVGPELASQFEDTRVVRIKVMVDPGLLAGRADWLDYTQQLVAATGASFSALFGIELRLQGVVLWEQPPGADAAQLAEQLAGRERDGADVVLGLIARSRPAGYAPPDWSGGENGGHALVFADLDGSDRYYRNMLRALAELFGAQAVVQRDAPGWGGGNFMSDAEAAAPSAPTLDAKNRGLVLINKQRPFAGGPTAGSEDGAAGRGEEKKG